MSFSLTVSIMQTRNCWPRGKIGLFWVLERRCGMVGEEGKYLDSIIPFQGVHAT